MPSISSSGARVDIGLPVYNGENYLVEALESILAQTFTDFDLIICDNASTDRTDQICRDYAARDRRIRYLRNERNLGAAPNYNRTVEESSGEYFKWAAHDDLMTPDYMEKCVAALEREPAAVLCHSLVNLIDEDGRSLDVHDSRLRHSDSPRASTRFASLALRPHQCTDLDGVIRRKPLLETQLIAPFHGSDRSLLCELALCGKFLQVAEPLFMTREHPDRYRRAATRPDQRLVFHDTSRAGRPSFPTWRLYSEYVRMIRRHVPQRRERLLCYAHLVRWWPVNWNWARMAVDLLAAVSPGTLIRAEKLKQRVFSPEPGPTVDRERSG